LPVEIYKKTTTSNIVWSVPAVKITDKPAFAWRGMMLDVSRYFFTKEFVLKYLDLMAMHKMNVLHWHLVDDGGWRIEIKKYPKLTTVGGFRGEGEDRYGGFYTQDDIREIVAYAAKRNIQIMPEIEIPAHTLSALAAYPYLGCTGKQLKVPTRQFISRDIYCVGRESTWVFLKDVFTEVCELFPFEYIHVGGDEAKFDRWVECPKCQAKKKELGFKTEKQLQGWITCRVEDFLRKKNKRMIGWADILETGISKEAGIMVWHHTQRAIKGAKRGNKVVMSPSRHAYFDFPESRHPNERPAAAWLGPISLEKAYSWDPIPQKLPENVKHNILGASACLWSDQLVHKKRILADKKGEGTHRSEQYIEYLSLPRMAALAEVTWVDKKQRTWEEFQTRMNAMYTRYSLAGYNYRMPLPVFSSTKQSDGTVKITLDKSITGMTTRYTLDDTVPTATSKIFTKPIVVKNRAGFRASTISFDGKIMSLATMDKTRVPKNLRHFGEVLGMWSAGEVSANKPAEVIFDATGKITGDGKYTITFSFTKGKNALVINGIEVLKNDIEFTAKDIHVGKATRRGVKNKYTITVDNYETGASYKVKTTMFGGGGSDSKGFVFIKKDTSK